MNELPVRVGVGVFVVNKEKQILVGLRIGSHGTNTWSLPGGHLEFGEDVEACAKREVLEETGLEILAVQPVGFTNDFFRTERKHYVTLFVVADVFRGTLERKEPTKSLEWRWVEWPQIPKPIFLPLENFMKSGQSPWKNIS